MARRARSRGSRGRCTSRASTKWGLSALLTHAMEQLARYPLLRGPGRTLPCVVATLAPMTERIERESRWA